MRASTRRALRRALYMASNWQLPAHIGLALTLGLFCGLVAQRYRSMIPPPDAVMIGALIVYPLMLTIWWRMHRD